MIKIFHNTEYILEARLARTKSNRYLDNINLNLQNSAIFHEHFDSSKNIKFVEINEGNNIRLNERRGSVRESTFSHQMKLFKSEFSFNKHYENNNSNNNQDFSNNYSSVNGDSSISYIDKSKEINFGDLRANSTKINENFLEEERLSNNFKNFMDSQKKNFELLSDKNSVKYKTKLIKYIRNELKEMKNQRKFLINHSKSCKLLNNIQFEKGIFKSENKIFNLLKKESSGIEDENNSFSKSFFSFDKKCNRDSSLDYFINSEKDNNESQDAFNNEKFFFLSTKGNNTQLKLQPKKELSLFSKSDIPVFKYSTLKNNRKKSLFKDFKDEMINNKNSLLNVIIQKKKTKENEKFSKKRVCSDKNIRKKRNSFINRHFGKILIKNKKRGSSPDFTKVKAKIKLLERAKNLVLIEDNESENSTSKRKSSYESRENNNKSHNILKLKSSSSISDDSDDNPNTKKEENEESIDEEGVIKNNENQEYEKILFPFEENFFINTEMNSKNKNLVNILKEWLIELNEEIKINKEEEENNKLNSINILKSTESGTKFSNFKLILPVAKGGYGNVGLYKKISTGDLYIIKSVDINKMKELKLSKTLKNERNIMKEISSDYVVTCYYLFKDKINCYFVMEYLPGGDVYNLLSSIILPFSTIQLIVAETLLAVKYLHSKNIIHHDIKLENILITKNGHFKLSDFGLSKTINEKKIKITDEENSSLGNSSNSSLIDTEHERNDDKVEGTLFYMAPELFTGDFPIGKPIDYWAIGIIIYELFTFKVPFEAETPEETKKNIINYNINWEPLYSDEVSKHYQQYIDSAIDLIKKFIFFNPNQRWGDNDFDKIKSHDFFKDFDWTNIKSIKNSAVLSYLKKFVEKNNKKINEYNKGNGENNEIICEENLTYDEENNKFSQRLDNLQKRNIELIKLKYKKKEIKIEEHDKNFKHSLFFDLQ